MARGKRKSTRGSSKRSSVRAASAPRSARSGGTQANSARSRSAAGRRAARPSHERASAKTSGRSRGSAQRRQATAGSGSRRLRGGRGNGEALAIKLLKIDHREVEQLARRFEKAERAEKRDIAERIFRALSVHARIEEELFYPPARTALGDDGSMIAEARVEHASLKDLIGQLESMGTVDELFEAKVKVLTEYTQHHVKEEEEEIFPRVQKAGLDLEGLGEQMRARKEELMRNSGETKAGSSDEEDSPSPTRGRSARQAVLNSRRG